MLFNSYEYVFAFLPAVFFVYFYLSERGLVVFAKSWLALSSLFFFSWWNIAYLPLLLGSVIVNYSFGATLSKPGPGFRVRRKSLLLAGIVFNLGLLGYFKYADFFINNLNFISGSTFSLLSLALPIGISFFTFQQIAFLVDSYRREVAECDFINYAVFVTFFPQLIAGPIVHHKEMMPQFGSLENKVINYKNVGTGLFIFFMGLFKKVVVADSFAAWATTGFDEAGVLTFLEGWAVSLSYTFQLYFDFSGYTDMAIGAALLFNIKLPLNFNSPYKAVNIQDFWRRWHMTLGRFMKDYVYIPLGGNKAGGNKTYRNLLITFLLIGFWHGAGWLFVFWGVLHGLALVAHRFWKNFNFKMSDALAMFLTFNFINITWVFFRAKEWEDAIKVLRAMCGLNGLNLTHYQYFPEMGLPLFGLFISITLAVVLFRKNSNHYIEHLAFNGKTIFVFSVLYFIAFVNIGSTTEFLYFGF